MIVLDSAMIVGIIEKGEVICEVLMCSSSANKCKWMDTGMLQ